MVSMQLNSWLSTQATPPVAEPTLRGLEAIAAADGWMVALVGMSIVFVALFLLFLVMVGLLYWFMRSPAKTFLSTRHEAAKREMTEATALREEAEARLAKYDSLLKGLEDEIASIR